MEITLTDRHGRIVQRIDADTESSYLNVLKDAFDIEKEHDANWNNFIYKLCQQIVDKREIIQLEFNDVSFGSWYIETLKSRILYDGKDSLLIFQKNENGKCINYRVIEKGFLALSLLLIELKRFS